MSCTWTGLFEEDSESLQVVNLGTLADNMVYLLPGCSDLMIRKTLQSVYREFCETAASLRMTANIDLVVDVQDYALSPQFSCIVDSVCKVWIGDRILKAGKDYEIIDGSRTKIGLDARFVVNIDAANAPVLGVECVLVPEVNSEGGPSWFIKKYGAAIVSGALYRLFSMTNRPWSDPAQASREFNNYQNAANRSRLAICSGDGSVSGSGEIDCINRGGMT